MMTLTLICFRRILTEYLLVLLSLELFTYSVITIQRLLNTNHINYFIDIKYFSFSGRLLLCVMWLLGDRRRLF